MALSLIVNGEACELPALRSPSSLEEVIARLELAGDRVAVERNGEIAARSTWANVQVFQDDRLEIVHFVGGGLGPRHM